MRLDTRTLVPLVAAPLLVCVTAAAVPAYATADQQDAIVDLSGRWQLNKELSDTPPQPGESREPGSEGYGPGRRPRGGPPGGFPGGGLPGGPGGTGGGGMRPPSREDMEKLREAMRATLEAPAEIVVTRNGEEVVFTAPGTGEVTRLRVSGQKRKTTAGGVEHDVKASYKDNSLVVESSFGLMTVVDTWSVSSDNKQLVRVTKMKGGGRGPGGADGNRELRRVYDRVE